MNKRTNKWRQASMHQDYALHFTSVMKLLAASCHPQCSHEETEAQREQLPRPRAQS